MYLPAYRAGTGLRDNTFRERAGSGCFPALIASLGFAVLPFRAFVRQKPAAYSPYGIICLLGAAVLQPRVDATRTVFLLTTNNLLASFRKIAFANLPRCPACGAKLALVSGFEANCHFSPSLRSACISCNLSIARYRSLFSFAWYRLMLARAFPITACISR